MHGPIKQETRHLSALLNCTCVQFMCQTLGVASLTAASKCSNTPSFLLRCNATKPSWTSEFIKRPLKHKPFFQKLRYTLHTRIYLLLLKKNYWNTIIVSFYAELTIPFGLENFIHFSYLPTNLVRHQLFVDLNTNEQLTLKDKEDATYISNTKGLLQENRLNSWSLVS